MTGPLVGSYQTRVVIQATPSQAADAFVSYWSNAILSDLRGLLNTVTITKLEDGVRRVAAAAQTWYRDAWDCAARTERRFLIVEFGLSVFTDPNQQGALLADIDILTGDYTIADASTR